jgi:phytanoyl-CoA hydroxylase
VISPTDLDHYRKQGFLVVRGLIDAERAAQWDARFRDLIEGRAKAHERILVVRDVMIAKGAVEPKTPLHAINKIHSFEDDPILFAHSQDDRVLDCVEALIGPGVMSIATNVINKPPGVDGRHPLHQDLTYFPLRPPEWIVGAWTALASCSRDNGCLAVVPGSQTGGHRKHADPDWEHVNAFFFGAEGAEREARVHLEMDVGDTVFFHPLLLHGSGHNRTDGFRRAITTHYARRDCERVGRPDVSVHTYRPLRRQRRRTTA